MDFFFPLGICYVPGTALGSRDIKTNKTQSFSLGRGWIIDIMWFFMFSCWTKGKPDIFPESTKPNRMDQKWKTGKFQHLNDFIYEDIDKISQASVLQSYFPWEEPVN